MPMGYINPKDFEKNFKIKQGQDSEETQVIETHSGRVHLLKSADSGVSYKNLNENNIEETHLLQDAYNRSIITDQTDEYDTGITTNHNETAPQINKQTILTDSYHATANSVTETVNTADHRETLNLDQDVYIQNRQESIPTKLQQKMSHFGGLATKALKCKVNTKGITGQNYTSTFGQVKISSGSTTISGKGSITAKSIVIG